MLVRQWSVLPWRHAARNSAHAYAVEATAVTLQFDGNAIARVSETGTISTLRDFDQSLMSYCSDRYG